jgi:hypothetical protein
MCETLRCARAEDNVEFYVKCGYKRKEIQMAHYFEHAHHATGDAQHTAHAPAAAHAKQ